MPKRTHSGGGRLRRTVRMLLERVSTFFACRDGPALFLGMDSPASCGSLTAVMTSLPPLLSSGLGRGPPLGIAQHYAISSIGPQAQTDRSHLMSDQTDRPISQIDPGPPDRGANDLLAWAGLWAWARARKGGKRKGEEEMYGLMLPDLQCFGSKWSAESSTPQWSSLFLSAVDRGQRPSFEDD